MARWAVLIMLLSITAIGCSRETENVSEQKKEATRENVATSGEYFVRILPESPTIADNILAEIKIKDEGRFSSKLKFIWEKDNQPVAGLNSQRIEGSRFKKGDNIRVKVIPQGGEAKGKVFFSDAVVIQNALPAVVSIKIKPDRNISKKDTLIATIEAKDADSDAVSLKYQWIRNGTENIEGANSNTLPPAHFKHGDFINVRVTANDGITDGETVTSGPIAIINSPPEIVSQPPIEVKGFNYIYKVSAVDLDKDNLNYSLTKAPAGMSISASGEIKWDITEKDEGKHDVEIAIEDGNGGRTVQGYLLTIKLPR